MIRDPSRSEHRNAVVPSDPREIFPQPRQHFWRNEIAAFFGAEYAMDQNVGIFMGHPANIHIGRWDVCAGCHIARNSSLKGHPALPCRAFTSRAFGTGPLALLARTRA